jgi:hypothetical protein
MPGYKDPGRAKVKNSSEGSPRRGEPSVPAMDTDRARESQRQKTSLATGRTAAMTVPAMDTGRTRE